MRLLFIRHGDPDYIHDTLTEKGRREARLLADRIGDFGIDDIYQSPLGRARDTAAYSLAALGRTAVTLDWLEEFPAKFDPNRAPAAARAFRTELRKDPLTGRYEQRGVWDILPAYAAVYPELFDRSAWRDTELVRASDTCARYDTVTAAFDGLLRQYGYVREGDYYRVEKGSSRVIAFFCHFGISAVLLSRLWNVSPFVTLQNLCMAPTSVTEIVTEEREQGTAAFRTLRTGDISHLTIAGEPPSFSARFCERFENADERH